MKSQIRMVLALCAIVLATLAGASQVAAQGTTVTSVPGTWASSINVQNLTGVSNAISISFYNAAGAVVYTHPDTLAANAGKSYYLPSIAGLSAGQYSAVVNSADQVRAVVNSESSAPYTGYAYSGISSTETATTLYYPGLYKNYYGFWSEVVLQNTTGNPANVTLAFNNGAAQAPINATIPANSSRVFALGDLGGLPAGNATGKYSLVVTSTSGAKLAGIANVWTGAFHGEATSYNAFTGGTTTAYAPALYKNYYNYVSALTVQNVSGATATGTVTYSNGTSQNFSIPAGGSVEYYQPNNAALPGGNTNGVFSAKITSNNAVVTLVTVEDKTLGTAASYNGPTTATTTVLAPVVMKAYYGYFTAITVQNVGNAATTATVTYATGQSRNATIPANGTYNFIQLAGQDPLPDGTTTSARITSNNGQPLVAVVQENNPTRYSQVGGGDYLFAYTGSAQ